MSEQLTPKPGEIWLTETSPRSPWATVWNGEKWEWLSDRKVCDFQGRRLVSDGPIGYTAEHVDELRARLQAAAESRDAWMKLAVECAGR